MKYAKPSYDASVDFDNVFNYLQQLGIGVVAGAWSDGTLTVEVEQQLAADILFALELVEIQES